MYSIKKENRVPVIPCFHGYLSADLNARNPRSACWCEKNQPLRLNLARDGSQMSWELSI